MTFGKCDYESAFAEGSQAIIDACKDGEAQMHLITFEQLKAKVEGAPAAFRLIGLFDTPKKVQKCIEAFALPFQIQVETDTPLPESDWVSFPDESAVDEKEANSMHHLPEAMHEAWLALQTEAKEVIGKKFRISSGYRSPTYQLELLCRCYQNEVASGIQEPLSEVFSYAAPSFCSKHNKGTVIDIPEFRLKTDSNPFGYEGLTDKNQVYDQDDYKAFVELAQKHGFFQSYPQNSTPGTLEEPWEFIWQPRDRLNTVLKNPKPIDFSIDIVGELGLCDYSGEFPLNDPSYTIGMPPVTRENWLALVIKIFAATREGIYFGEFFYELSKRGALNLASVENFLATPGSLTQKEREIFIKAYYGAGRAAQKDSPAAHEEGFNSNDVPARITGFLKTNLVNEPEDLDSVSIKAIIEDRERFNRISLRSLFY